MFSNVTLIGGSGAVATLLADSLAQAGANIFALVDLRQPEGGKPHIPFIEDDIRHPQPATLQALAASDLVVLATPEEAALAALPVLFATLNEATLLVETLSVKGGFSAGLTATLKNASSADAGPQALGINPMFAPSLGFMGRSVITVPYRSGERLKTFMGFMVGQGARVVTMDADGHDRACAALQAATHAAIISFGIALRNSGYDMRALESIMPPPHRTLLALLARIVSGDSEVYRDIQAANPFAHETREQLTSALQTLNEVVASGHPAAFRSLFDDLRQMFAGAQHSYASLCAKLFADVRNT